MEAKSHSGVNYKVILKMVWAPKCMYFTWVWQAQVSEFAHVRWLRLILNTLGTNGQKHKKNIAFNFLLKSN